MFKPITPGQISAIELSLERLRIHADLALLVRSIKSPHLLVALNAFIASLVAKDDIRFQCFCALYCYELNGDEIRAASLRETLFNTNEIPIGEYPK